MVVWIEHAKRTVCDVDSLHDQPSMAQAQLGIWGFSKAKTCACCTGVERRSECVRGPGADSGASEAEAESRGGKTRRAGRWGSLHALQARWACWAPTTNPMLCILHAAF